MSDELERAQRKAQAQTDYHNAKTERAALVAEASRTFLGELESDATRARDAEIRDATERMGAALVRIDDIEFEEAKANGWLNRIFGK